ncbi:MAG TPA: MarR family transcriptional regulator [Gemmatimonadales bacterium]|nr:MarR family transcriptional regulator [Gemmatimonadales bacterium]
MSDRAIPPRNVADRLHSAAIHLLRRVRRQDPEMGIGPAQASALSVLVFAGPRTLGALADAEQVRPPTMTRIVAGLEQEGLVRRRPDPDDGRVVRLEASARGRRLLQLGRKRRVADIAARLDRLAPSDVALLGQAAALVERLVAGP